MSSSTSLWGVQPPDVGAYWPRIAEFLKPAFDRSDLKPETVMMRAIATKMQVWLAWDSIEKEIRAAAVTEVQERDKYKVCVIVLLAGDKEYWTRYEHVVFAWARSIGCQRIRLEGRFGWERALPGWTRAAVVMEKML